MVSVEFTSKGNKLSLKLQGHAGQAELGRDIVCSACTILAYTTAQVVKNESETGGLEATPKIDFDNGNATIICKPTRDRFEAVYNAFAVVQTGFSLLAHNFPQNVELKMFGKAS